MAAPNSGEMLKQAGHIWKMLDQLAETDPEAYKKFIQNNMTEGKKNVALPEPFTCIKTKIIKGREEETPLYINVCQWSRVPGPKTPTDAVPITGGPLEERNLESCEGHCKVTRVAINPDVLKECLLHEQEMKLLVKLICSYLEEQHGIRISNEHRFPTEKYFGDVAELKNFFGKEKNTFPVDNLETPSPETLLARMNEMSVADEMPDPEFLSLAKNDSGKPEAGKRVLIEELSTVEVDPLKPKYEMSIRERDKGKGRRAVLRVELPGVNSVSECDLQISEAEVTLRAADKFHLIVEIEEPFIEDMVSAKFYRKSSTLSVTLPLAGD